MPLGIINYRLDGVDVDAYYLEHELIVELDSIEYHSDPKTFNRDRKKDRENLAKGRATARLTWEAHHLDPAGEAELFRAILAQRSGRSG